MKIKWRLRNRFSNDKVSFLEFEMPEPIVHFLKDGDCAIDGDDLYCWNHTILKINKEGGDFVGLDELKGKTRKFMLDSIIRLLIGAKLTKEESKNIVQIFNHGD